MSPRSISRMVTMAIARRGICFLSSTLLMKEEKGVASSRANAHKVLEAEARQATLAVIAIMTMKSTNTVVKALDLVACKKMAMNGKPVGVTRMLVNEPVENASIMA